MNEEQNKFSLLAKILNGGIAGIAGVSALFPIDLAKTRLQSQRRGPAVQSRYTGLLDCLVKTAKAEGFWGLYRGVGINLLLVTPEKALKLASNDLFRHLLTTKDGKLPVSREMLAGAGAGVIQVFVTTPMELLKVRLQNSGGQLTEDKLRTSNPVPQTLTTRTLFRELTYSRGVRGLYQGYSATLLRNVTFSILYFPLFAHLSKLGPRRSPGSSQAVFWWSFLCGCTAGAVSAVAVTPADVVKTRLQLQADQQRYGGIVDAFKQILRLEGGAALMVGALPRVLVIAPLFGMAQMVYFLGIGERILGIQQE